MAEIVRMPRLSDTMTEGVVAEWHKKVGDKVASGDLLADIETDKATLEFESFFDGVLLYIGVQKGGSAPVNNILAIIGNAGENVDDLIASSGSAVPKEEVKEAPKAETPKEESIPASVKEESKPVEKQAAPVSTNNGSGRIFASPLARAMAEDKGVNLTSVKGSGEAGRIVKRDIENYTPTPGSVTSSATVGVESYTEVPNSQMRKAIAKTLAASKFSAPHFYLKMEVDMDNAILARTAINSDEGVKVSFNDIIIKAVSVALRKNPKVNADWMGESIRYNNHIHIGVAVAVEDGLVVPVVKFADTKGIAQLGSEIKDLASRARDKKIKPEEMQGGTFAVSNLGMYGIEDFTSIINPPNGCILSVGQIKSTPVIKNGQIVLGNVLKLSLSCDHRVVDGAIGSEFLQTLKELLENPIKMIV